jgi:predicted ABC-type ATPase
MSAEPPRIYVLAGVNGAGKSSIGGAAFRAFGGDYYNPDEAARRILAATPNLNQAEANSRAWHAGRALLERAINERVDFAFETTLGAATIPRLLVQAAKDKIQVRVWYVGLATAELHVARVRARVARGGHDIPEDVIRRRFGHSRMNLIELMPLLTALRVYDNSTPADPAAGKTPVPDLVLHMERGKIMNPKDLATAPEWAKPIAAAAMKLELKHVER